MTTIAKFRRRRRNSDSSSDSSNIDLSLNDTDDTNSFASYQTNSVVTNASEQDPSRRPSTSTSDSYGSDSEQQYRNSDEDDDDSDNDNDSLHFASESSNMDAIDTALNDKLSTEHMNTSDTVKAESSTDNDTSTCNPSSATLNSQKRMDTPHGHASKDHTYNSGRDNPNIQREKKLWWGDNGNEAGHPQRQSISYSRKESTYPTIPGKDKHDGGWKSPFKSRRLNSNWRNAVSEQQTTAPRNDWRNQLSATTEDKAASHWTMAGIDQHLLESKTDELNWKKKQQQAKHDVEWPSLHKQQQQQQQEQEQHPPASLAPVATERETAPISNTERAPKTSLPDRSAGSLSNSLSAPPPPTKTTHVDPDSPSSQSQQNPQPSVNSSIQPPEIANGNAYTDKNQNTTPTVSRDESPANDASDLGTSKSWSAVVKLPLHERNTPIIHSTTQMADTGSWAESISANKESKESTWGKWPQTLDDDTKPRKPVTKIGSTPHQLLNSTHPSHQQRLTLDINFDGSDEPNGSSCGKWTQKPDDITIPSKKTPQVISTPEQPLDSIHLTHQQGIKTDNDFGGCNDRTIRVVLPSHHAPKTKHGYLDNKRALLNSEQDISRQLKNEQRIQSEQDTTGEIHDDRPIQKKQDTFRRIHTEQRIQSEQGTAQQSQTEQCIHTEPSAINNNVTTDNRTVDLQDQHQSPASASSTPSSPKLLSLSEYVRKAPIVRHAMDEAWWRAANWEEIKESDMGLKQQQQQQQQQQQTQPYYYIPPWMMISPNSNGVDKWVTSQRTETSDLPVETCDDPDYNRYQIPYTTPSGYHHSGSSSHSTPFYFKNNQPNTRFY